MLDKILAWFGLVRTNRMRDIPINFEENYKQFDGEKFSILKEKLRANPEFKEYLDWTIVQDIKRFFSAHPSEHQLIRGAITRTRYLRTLCVEEDGKRLPIQRYL